MEEHREGSQDSNRAVALKIMILSTDKGFCETEMSHLSNAFFLNVSIIFHYL
jgi:hypothetical protein